jgi:hypothetical protein
MSAFMKTSHRFLSHFNHIPIEAMDRNNKAVIHQAYMRKYSIFVLTSLASSAAYLVDLEEHAYIGNKSAIRFTVSPTIYVHITHCILIIFPRSIVTSLTIIDCGLIL